MGILGTVTSKGQTTIPKAVRDELGLEDGSRIEWEITDGKASIIPRTLRMIDLAGVLGNPLGRPTTIEEMDEAVAAAVARHVLGEDDGDSA
ncbi:AbrB/MazE/SpoVT family DNA-binding domain-containing protein [Aurantimonas sp. C2-6-R+9]|uniref:AbrB/MazE/SpoVT family DNA-binding domain-containing protein n=2 Tax=root TaxID=1 RepID=A0A9C9TK23_9HYPH|nr:MULTISPECIES: AbrB/MazE/SpoVT family DNA-binding domain-containing protein [unclassified Aurantimonas]MEC5289246.1 AbrB/MazE/SpoVT family DNA-binding domain-containing protein [Aurantimonas sp. C2-3-R2]MEC5323034.1 AbrB/MazE/SpoVT family DNA-binding domain-containing protein [Aurantimonas sp. A3-2-R12]MEC5380118.1 AbrB/MazE/SpoVT family DNA-binding domain-containing protein [Aurantimonas sp. C2-6-R+9]MEC5410304.1 AbrB/MazE/SpoVT family DNA-binding domain-containing protein [Aurantimonas sp. 